ncbi:MAG: hypothetical protein ACLGHO_02135, partial [Gammaproteobacteria bacterium]
NAAFAYDPDVLVHIVARCQEVDTGARNIENILTRTMLPQLATECLAKMARSESISSVRVGVTGEGQFTYAIA